MIKERYFIYGTERCPFCVMATNYLSATHTEHYFYDLSDEEIIAVKEFYDWPTVPMIVSNEIVSGRCRFIGGYSEMLEKLNPP